MNFHVSNPGFQARMSTYYPKGDGRDTYISFNNGGIWSKKTYTDPIESGQYFKSPKYTSKKSNIPAKNVHYPPDGSGRDVFIKFDEGGVLQNNMNNPHLNKYISSLRSYNRSSYGPRPKIPDFFMESQKSLSMKDYIKYCDNARIQKDLINRLVTLPEHKLPVIKNNNQGKIGKKNNGYHNSQIIK